MRVAVWLVGAGGARVLCARMWVPGWQVGGWVGEGEGRGRGER